MKEFKMENDGHQYILTIIDCFSKYAFVVPLKDKSASEVKEAFKKVFTARKPLKIQTDRGKEFVNQTLKSFFKDNMIHFFTTKNEQYKCAIVERFNRTLKEKMYRYFTSAGNRRYINVLPKLVQGYNNSYHSSIRTTPSSVGPGKNSKIFKNLYGTKNFRDLMRKKIMKNNISPGDKVRLVYKRNPFDKGFLPNWTDQIYTVENIIKRHDKPMYEVSDYSQKIFPRRLYPEEIQKVTENIYRIEKILKRRVRNGKTEYLIKWLNYPSDFNSWEPAENVLRLGSST